MKVVITNNHSELILTYETGGIENSVKRVIIEHEDGTKTEIKDDNIPGTSVTQGGYFGELSRYG